MLLGLTRQSAENSGPLATDPESQADCFFHSIATLVCQQQSDAYLELFDFWISLMYRNIQGKKGVGGLGGFEMVTDAWFEFQIGINIKSQTVIYFVRNLWLPMEKPNCLVFFLEKGKYARWYNINGTRECFCNTFALLLPATQLLVALLLVATEPDIQLMAIRSRWTSSLFYQLIISVCQREVFYHNICVLNIWRSPAPPIMSECLDSTLAAMWVILDDSFFSTFCNPQNMKSGRSICVLPPQGKPRRADKHAACGTHERTIPSNKTRSSNCRGSEPHSSLWDRQPVPTGISSINSQAAGPLYSLLLKLIPDTKDSEAPLSISDPQFKFPGGTHARSVMSSCSAFLVNWANGGLGRVCRDTGGARKGIIPLSCCRCLPAILPPQRSKALAATRLEVPLVPVSKGLLGKTLTCSQLLKPSPSLSRGPKKSCKRLCEWFKQ